MHSANSAKSTSARCHSDGAKRRDPHNGHRGSTVTKRCPTCRQMTRIPEQETECRACRRAARVERERAERKQDADTAEVKLTLLAYATALHGHFPTPRVPTNAGNHHCILHQLTGLNLAGRSARAAKRKAPPPVDDGSFVHWLLSADAGQYIAATWEANGYGRR